ncbi:NAD(P)-binding protein [Heyndrickxia acidicola]|uniref:precorrin-2 dehydrogenase n=1 Tax=Heyndrickxia acidicola TaxID=209389 RepID=A0ABU6MN59_9BACI|nr:NAD(P)-binding protein [Heyndrickxia acidicola]MED1205416.1 NAD(P)-binding protein [Heyndrickxia acidicola]
MGSIPIMMDFQNKEIVIVGGGEIAKRRLKLFTNTGAQITIVSPKLLPELQEMQQRKLFNWKKKKYQAEDAVNAQFIIIATNNPFVNQYVRESAPKSAFVNHTESAERGNFHFPASFQRGRLTVSVSTGGASPYLAAKIKNQVEKTFDEQYGVYVDFLYECRQLLKKTTISSAEKTILLKEILKDDYKSIEKQKEILAKILTLQKEP